MTESRAAQVQRIDAHFRGTFPNLVTRIFETSHEQFLITFAFEQQDAVAIAEEFDQTIRFASVAVKLANELPSEFVRELFPLTDAQAAGDYVGLPLNVSSFNTLVSARFPDVPFLGAREDFEERRIHLVVSAPVSKETEVEVVAFADSVGLPFPSDLNVEPQETTTGDDEKMGQALAPENALRITAPKFRPKTLPFVRADDAFWFENLSTAAAGRLPLERFPGVTPGAFRAFVDLSTGRHVNLRQTLLLYDEVYCSLPLRAGHDSFLKDQALTEADLLDAVTAGRLKIVSTQPEERLHVAFLEAVAERRPDAILGRRASALLLISDIAEMAERYRLRDPQLYPALREISEGLGPALGLSPASCLRALLWPQAARLRSIWNFLDEGTKKGPALLLADTLGEAVLSATNVDVRLEAMMLSERVHLGHALNATIFSALDEPAGFTPLAAVLGRELNFYRSFNTAIAAAWAANEDRRAAGVQVLPPIPLLSFDRKVPLLEVLDEGALGSTRAEGRALIHRLSDLPIEARETEVDALADRYRHRGRGRQDRILSLDNLDTGISIASTIGHFAYPPLMGVAHLAGQLFQTLRRIPAVDRLAQSFRDDAAQMLGGNQDLDFLSKVSRVAQLRREAI